MIPMRTPLTVTRALALVAFAAFCAPAFAQGKKADKDTEQWRYELEAVNLSLIHI